MIENDPIGKLVARSATVGACLSHAQETNAMAADRTSPRTGANPNWTTTQAYILAVVCLLLGGLMGYLVRGSGSASPAVTARASAPEPTSGMQQVTPETMKHMADKQAEPLLAELKANPNNVDTLVKVGNIYYDTQSFADAIGYYQRSLKLRDDANVRTDLGTAYWQLGDPDSAIREFEAALKLDPKHANTYYNLGLVKWQGKMDVNGAVSAWQKLLETNPDFPDKSRIERLISQAQQHAKMKPGTKTDKPVM
jgi:cytochrome c-type biogenesis protein CcmH/NrfG